MARQISNLVSFLARNRILTLDSYHVVERDPSDWRKSYEPTCKSIDLNMVIIELSGPEKLALNKPFINNMLISKTLNMDGAI